jgi:hypothetical protein
MSTVAIDETLRITVGRVRPRSSPDNAFVLYPGSGLTHCDHRSFPSLHSAVAFATAATLSEDRLLLGAYELPRVDGMTINWSVER